MFNNNGYDPSSTTEEKTSILLFKSVTDIVKFQNECECTDLYMIRDSLTLVGIFDEKHLEIALNKYFATIQIDRENVSKIKEDNQ